VKTENNPSRPPHDAPSPPKEPGASSTTPATGHFQARRAAKIAALKRAVESDTYDVTAEQVAEKLLQDTLRDLLS
jgi:hypothetical protein